MNCMDRDQDLLLFVHGELKTMRRRALQRHLRNCPMCRERHSQFATASRQVAAAVRGSRAPQWPGRIGRGISKSGWRLASLTALLIASGIGLVAELLIASGIGPAAGLQAARGSGPDAGGMRIHAASRAAHPVCAEIRPMPCRPDLPNDRCR